MANRIGFFICECGPNIGECIDIDEVLEVIEPMEGIVAAAKFGLLCSGDGKEFLKTNIREFKLTHLVVAACSPKQHELTFMEVCEEAGINPFLFQLANIREQVAWVTKDKAEATKKAIRLSKAAVRRVRYHDPLSKTELPVNADVLVVGGGVAGMTASLKLATSDRHVHLVERAQGLGGAVATYSATFPDMTSGRQLVEDLVERVGACEDISVYTNSDLSVAVGFFGNFEVVVTQNEETAHGRDSKLNVGAVIVATGAEAHGGQDLADLGHGTIDGVVTSTELEEMLARGTVEVPGGGAPKRVAIVHCVGRDEVGYCSEVCCMYSAKHAQMLMKALPGIEVHQVYRDLCVPGRGQQAYVETASKGGANLLRATSVEVEAVKGGINIKHSLDGGKTGSLVVDMVVLATAMVPSEGTSMLAEMLNIGLDDSGFFAEAHEKLDPMATGIDGIYIAGCSSGPRSIRDSVVQSEACAGRILSSLVPGRTIEPEIRVSHILSALCSGCQTCLEVCCYGAISYDPIKEISFINEAICRGCGNCVAACPSNAITLYHFTYKQIYQEIEEAIR